MVVVAAFGLATACTAGPILQAPAAASPSAVRSSQPAPTTSPPTPTSPAPGTAASTFLAWTAGGLPNGFAAAAARLPGVERATAVMSGTAWLTRSTSAGGAVIDQPPAGLAIPVEVAGADLATYLPFTPQADRRVLSAIARGEAVLGRTEAELRRARAGGALWFGPRRVRIAGVVADTAIGGHELLVSRSLAASLGLQRDRYLLLQVRPATSEAGLTTDLQHLIPGVALRVRRQGETPYLRQADAVLPPVILKRAFGEFAARPLAGGSLAMDPRWVRVQIVNASVPILGTVRCNRVIIPTLQGVLHDLVRRGLAGLIHPNDYGGCFSSRFIRGSSSAISTHTWGAAIDINVSQNRFGGPPHQDPRVVAAFARWGFTWGGRWLIPDGMHFEYKHPA